MSRQIHRHAASSDDRELPNQFLITLSTASVPKRVFHILRERWAMVSGVGEPHDWDSPRVRLLPSRRSS